MKRSRGSKSKSASGQGKATSSPPIGPKLRKRPAKKSSSKTSSNASDESVANKPQENANDSTAAVGVSNESHAATSGAQQDEDRATSPDPNCSICLCKMEDKSFTHSCFHMFCFTCLLEWSKIKAECPLCKQSFNSIIHNIRSESDYDVYYLRDADTSSPPAISTDDNLHYRPLMFAPGRSSVGPWAHFLSPIDIQFLTDFGTTPHGLTHGFYVGEAFNIFPNLEGRHHIYRNERWAREINLPPGMSYRNVSPAYFTANTGSDYWQRIATWLDRELETLSRYVTMRNHVRDYVMLLLQRYDILSANFCMELEPFFGSHTRLFINQLHNFTRSPLTIRETDRLTVYSDRPPTPPLNEVITLDRDDSDIEIVSPPSANTARRRRPRSEDWPPNISDPFLGLPLQTLDDTVANDTPRVNSPIAGPSGLLSRPQTNIPDRDLLWTFDYNATDLHEVSDTESSSASHCDNEIVVVGFDKPWRARSPISLSSDGSDVEVSEGCTSSTPSSSNKSPESEGILHLGAQNGPEIKEITKTPDAEGDASSEPWSEFSPDALSEISSRGSFDKSLDCFLPGDNPFIDFKCRLAPEKGLEDFKQGSDCIHGSCGICKRCKRRIVGTGCNRGNGSQVLPESSFLLRRQSRKRNCDDCGDSGVVVDVEQFSDVTEPPPKKGAYKKHYRGHKKSTNRPEMSLESDENQAGGQSVEPTIAGPCPEEMDVNGSISAAQEMELLPTVNGISLSCGVSDGTISSVHEPDFGKESPCNKCFHDRMDEELATLEQQDSPSSSVCDKLTDPETKTSISSFQCSLESTSDQKNLGSDASDESTMDSIMRSDSLETSSICDLDVSLHSIESVESDSDDSVQWLDSEKPASSPVEPVQQSSRHISICSNESYIYSPSISSVILQLSDEEEDDHSCVEGVSSVLGVTASRHSPQSSNLVSFEAADSYLGHSVDDKTKVMGVKHLPTSLENVSHELVGTVDDNSFISPLQSTRNELHNLDALEKKVKHVKCLPESSEKAVEHEVGDINGILKFGNVSNNMPCNENCVECLPESSENSLEREVCEINDILNFGNISYDMPCNEKMVNSVECFAHEVNCSAVQSNPITSDLDDSMSEFQTKTSSYCAVVDMFDHAITEADVSDDNSKKLQNNGPLPVDESC